MKNQLFVLLLSCFTQAIVAQPDYSTASIPAALLQNANLVVRRYDLKFEVLNKGEAIETEHKVLTLLNESAEGYNDQYFGYGQINNIEDIEGAIYDADGKLVRKIKKGDIEDFKPYEYFANDTRAKKITFPRRAYPYTIEYRVVTRHNGLMFYPEFQPQESTKESIESASLELIMPSGLEARILELNLPKNCKTASMRWEFKSLPALGDERFTPVDGFPLPLVLCAPTQFSIEGYDGDFNTWESYGHFISKLNEGKDQIPLESVEKMRQLTENCPDIACKVQTVYQHLQENFRYFYVGFGIGGWQPMLASDVDKFKYSDCKGLSNYTVSMLRAIGIPAYYALIRATENEQKQLHPEFPNARFNHAIACVPLENDTIWLECTSQSESYGFTSDFTDNRPALLITPEGGKLVQTPKYDEHDNTIRRQTTVNLSLDGSALIHSNNVYSCISQNIFSEGADWPLEQWKKYLYSQLNLSDFEIKSLEITRQKGSKPQATQILELSAPKFAALSGKRLFVPLAALSDKISVPITDGTRRYDVQAHSRGFTEEDQIQISIPEGYRLENEFSPVSFQSGFGSFELSVKSGDGNIMVHRKLVMNNSIHPKEQFETFIAFLKNIAKADKTKLVLVKGT